MLTKEQARKLGLQYVDQVEESTKINYFASSLNNKLNSLNSSVPRLVTQIPVDSSSDGVAGSIALDSEYLYICKETNVWKRIKLNEL